MADIDITVTAGAVMGQTFAGIPPGGFPNTIYPRARVTFSIAGTITAKIATNSTTVTVNFTLPANFAYVMERMAPQVTFATNIADAGHFNDVAFVSIGRDGASGTLFSSEMFSRGLSNIAGQGGSQKMWIPSYQDTGLFFNQDGIAPLCRLVLSDNDLVNATVVGTVTGQAQFLQYDLEQAISVMANAPQPVISRS